ncbi:uncharacterized protein [Macrobrachium rosenbergii]|uniref:uncharacterized protein n=1 Tax=Macrobrachium rosenbergii TaxID=79674 RepID=UPI0034D77309
MILIDAGAVWSVFPPSREDCKRLPDPAASLTAANGSPILSCGTKLLSVSILGRRYKWNFIIADVGTPLLGADFLAHFGLAVDVGRKRLLDTESCQSLPLVPGPSMPTICSVAPHQYASLLKEFPEVLRPKLRQVPGAPTKHGIYHHIKMRGPPTHAKFRRLPPQRLQEAKNAFADMERMGICRKAPNPSHKEHLQHIRKVLQRLQENSLIIRFDKCTFSVERVDFLDHEISPGGIRPLALKVEVVIRFPNPTSVKGMQEFLRMVNYYRRFIPGVAHTMGPPDRDPEGPSEVLSVGPQPAAGLLPDEGRPRQGCDELVRSETTVIHCVPPRDSRSHGKVSPDIEKYAD